VNRACGKDEMAKTKFDFPLNSPLISQHTCGAVDSTSLMFQQFDPALGNEMHAQTLGIGDVSAERVLFAVTAAEAASLATGAFALDAFDRVL
jgi:voltage-gated potassium channel Kch